MGEGVMVFAPAPQLTVTIEQVGHEPELHLHAGGQAIWQARMISSLGVPVTFCTVLGDGEVGQALTSLIEQEGLELKAIRRRSDSGWYVHDRRGDDSRQEIAQHAGAPLGRHDNDELYALALSEGLKAGLCVLSGVPDPALASPDTYRRLGTDLQRNGAKVAADLTGDHLAAVLDAGLTFLKVSDEELYADGLADESAGDESVVKAAKELAERGAETVVISRAEKPAIALVDGEVLQVHMPELSVRDHHGAGDSMTAGVVAVLARGGDVREAIRTGAAAGALNVTRHGLGTGRADAISELVGRVRLEPLEDA
ncbi:PfkB domain protein [Kribbella flavida DSM 17836]|uniref:PfkB domain protein n=1 Tax=Kribbella flavida (strain DSM 17836 / JCM 10339 / NBRC 14399) TaxID=479435 RepID=D2Q2Y0_KRIFD|nr:PfkB family carbohydrate kinase [Kribbella flavida]ADB30311.1 PfkB domain protein [Kribbella flavida DSM 17836]